MQAGFQLRIVWLILLSALAPYAEAAPRLLTSDDTCGMSCCRRAKSCCCRKARPSSGWAAARTCPPNCGQPAKLPGAETQAQVPAQIQVGLPAPVRRHAVLREYQPVSANARITRQQRPPPEA